MPAKRMAALTTPIKAPPAMKPDASRVPFSRRTLFRAWSLLRLPTYQLMAPPISNGVFNSSGMNMPNANANAGILQKFRMMASTAPMAYSAHTSYNQCRYHAGCPFQPDGNQNNRCQDQGHQCHA